MVPFLSFYAEHKVTGWVRERARHARRAAPAADRRVAAKHTRTVEDTSWRMSASVFRPVNSLRSGDVDLAPLG